MALSKTNQYFFERIVERIDALNDIGGPETHEEHIAILKKIKDLCEERIEISQGQIEIDKNEAAENGGGGPDDEGYF